ncbi:MAG: polysaccharide deacetylase family protein [Succiniclasticum sp.]|uniref:polysaccharide deacetylase family protein n=1 Tax=Succiniclasticum sp. TaxID=2775030 RepID=UPI001B0B0C1E|nr:polysaccharide deacetylase family protein [Succiniclasticum sp.]MBO5637750.1 polysaccharide deacetylase family protein [Acidaminococcaceae bacterium]MDY6292236.1 polysaccharide deacetylase family protein [Succiniclasticum sp.]
MHLKKHLMFIFAILCALGMIYFYALSDMFHPKQIASYENFTEMKEEFDVTEEIAEASKNFNASKTPAGIIIGKNEVEGNFIALTFDGMDSRGNMEAILKIITDQGWHASFFVEGVNAARNTVVIQKLVQDENLIGNYSFVGISKAEQMTPGALFEQFCRTQKIIKLITGSEPKLFKLQDTRYMDELLRAAKACGLENAVQSDVIIPVGQLGDDEVMKRFVDEIQPGMIVSLQMGRPVPIQYTRKKGPDTPAIDKKPTVQDKQTIEAKGSSTVEIVKKLCNALRKKGLQSVTINALMEMNKQKNR